MLNLTACRHRICYIYIYIYIYLEQNDHPMAMGFVFNEDVLTQFPKAVYYTDRYHGTS